MLVKAKFGVQLGVYPGPAEGATRCVSLIAPNRFPGTFTGSVSHRSTPESLKIYLIHRNTKRQPKWNDKETGPK